MTFDRESDVMRKTILPWLVFFLVVFVPAFLTWGYARDSHRRELEYAATDVERGRLESAEVHNREIELAIKHAKDVVRSIPSRTSSLADATRILLASVPHHAELVSLPAGAPGEPLSSGRPGARPGWLHISYSAEGSERFSMSSGEDIVVLRELVDGQRVGFVFTAAKIEADVSQRIASRGLALERVPPPEKGVTPVELAARFSDLQPTAARFVGSGQIFLNPRAIWKVVVHDRGQAYRREASVSANRYVTRLVLAGMFVVIAFVLFVRGQRQKRLAELRTDYVAAVSHELRTPLASVRMFSELLEAEAIPLDERREVELSLANEARRLHGTLERMLRFGALSRGKLAAERTPTALRPVLDAAAARGGPRVVVEADAALEASIDAGLVGHALDNLVGNANKYAPEGAVVLRAARDGKDVVIDVVDQGPGLDSKARRKIWRPFERADDRLSRATQGTGVGLALVDGIARAHGGRATVASKPGAGATFTLRFPQKG